LAHARVRIQICGRITVEINGERRETRLPGQQGRLLLAYAVYQKDSVFIFAYAFTWIPYIRNLMIHHRYAKARMVCSACSYSSPPKAKFCADCGTKLAGQIETQET